jgi:hypothetical protein
MCGTRASDPSPAHPRRFSAMPALADGNALVLAVAGCAVALMTR